MYLLIYLHPQNFEADRGDHRSYQRDRLLLFVKLNMLLPKLSFARGKFILNNFDENFLRSNSAYINNEMA